MSKQALLFVIPFLLQTAGMPAAAEFDPVPTVLRVSELSLPADVRKGDHHEVMPEAENDGYNNRYRLASDFGRFEAYGALQLALRVMEIGALAQLDELSKTEVFADAAKRSALSSVDAVEQFADKPVETVKGIPSGAKKMFKVTKRRAKELKEDVGEEIDERREKDAEPDGESEGAEGDSDTTADQAVDAGSYLIKRYFGVTAAERRWAQKLGVDPYTDNEVLRAEIKKVARVDSAGRFGVKLLPIPSIPGASVIKTVNVVVWSKDPYELQDFNRARMRSMGVSEERIEAFFEVPWLSPSGQTIFLSAILGLEGAEDLPLAIEHVLTLESLDEGRFLVEAAQLLAWLHEKDTPIARLLRGERTLVALSADRRQIVPLPVDHLLWTPELAELLERRGPELDLPGVESQELWLASTASELCAERLGSAGWRVEERLRERMLADPRVTDSTPAP